MRFARSSLLLIRWFVPRRDAKIQLGRNQLRAYSSELKAILQPQPNSVPFTGLPPEYAIPAQPPSLAEAQAYCKRLALGHYDNFSVVTWFLPARLHQHFYNLYAYCRISDDLGDEVGDPQESLRLLDEWQSELDATYASLENSPREGT